MVTYKKFLLILFSTLIAPIVYGQYLDKDQALEDLVQFKALMENESSYYQLSNHDFSANYNKIEREILKSDSIPIYYLAFEFEKIIAETIDRHAGIKMMNAHDYHNSSNLYLPLTLAYFDDKFVGLKQRKDKGTYDYYDKKYPFLKSINDIPVSQLIDEYAYRRKNSPDAARITDGLFDVGAFKELNIRMGRPDPEKINITFTNNKKDKTITLPLSDTRDLWMDPGSLRNKDEFKGFYNDKNFDLKKLDKWLTASIGYLAIPAMTSFTTNPYIEEYLKESMEKYRDSKAIIIDLRGNGGGTRHILNTLSGYLVQPTQSPWVANVAYIRSDQRLDEDISSMQSRFLYNYNSTALTSEDRTAIDQFNTSFKTAFPVDSANFSAPFYMVLRSNANPLSCPVYILVNEESFSAASVFTSALKGLPNVHIAGITTNGSSGRSVLFYLKHSNIRVRLSTMLSFQRNGKPLDGHGTEPNIVIARDEDQVLGKRDSQLEELVDYIEKN